MFKKKPIFIPDSNIVEITTLLEGIELLTLHKVDGVYDDLAPLYHLLSSFNLDNLKVAIIEYDNKGSTIGIRNDAPILLSIINKAIESISEDEKNALKEKWLQFVQLIEKQISSVM